METTPLKTHSLVWQYFVRLPSGKAKCKSCSKEIACTSGNTSGLGRHLEAHHEKLAKVGTILLLFDLHFHFFSQELDSKRQERAGSGEKRKREAEDVSGSASKKPREDFFTPQVHHVDKDLQEKFDEALIEHITETCTSFAQYGESFQRLIHVISKKVKVKHPTSLSRMVDKSAEEVMKEITDIFRTGHKRYF